MRLLSVLSTSLLPASVLATNGMTPGAKVQGENGQVLQEMKIEAPGMDEEDQYGYNMPAKYMCAACKSVIWHVNNTMTAKHPKGRNWKESELLDIYDDICKPDTFEGYGIKLLNGENVLSGPALQEEYDKLAPGQASIQMGGDSWKKRLSEECRKLVYEAYGEEEVYEAFKKREFSGQWCYEDETARRKYNCKQTVSAKKKAKKEKKPKKEKKEKKEKKKAPTEKKLSLEAYVRTLANGKGAAGVHDLVTKGKTAAEWETVLAPLFENKKKPGNDEL